MDYEIGYFLGVMTDPILWIGCYFISKYSKSYITVFIYSIAFIIVIEIIMTGFLNSVFDVKNIIYKCIGVSILASIFFAFKSYMNKKKTLL